MTPPDSISLAGRIDHTLLKPDANEAQVEALCAEALEFGFASVCVAPRLVSLAARCLGDGAVAPGTVVGFPLGASVTAVKAFEARRAVEDGARELDMVVPLGALMALERAAVVEDIAAVVESAGSGVTVKVILETGLLNREQKLLGVACAREAGAHYVKTSTGMLAGGATVDDVVLLKGAAGEDLKVKASGGIRTYAQALGLVRAGADRLGTSSGVAIAQQAARAGAAS